MGNLQARPSRRWVVVVGCLAIVGCAPKSDLMHRLPDASAMATPPADKALVVFLRPAGQGNPTSAAVYEDDRFLGIVMRNARLAHEAEPGIHQYMVVTEVAGFLDAELEGGKIYFIEVQPRMGAWRARFSLAPVSPHSRDWSRLGDWLDDSYAVAPNADGVEWARNNASSVAKKKSRDLPRWMESADRPALVPADGVSEPPVS